MPQTDREISAGRSGTANAEARTRAQRERILNAAQQCFVDEGFHVASMASISATAGMSPGLIYRYFRGKNEIIVAIIERQLGLLRKEIAMLDGQVDLASKLTERYGNCSAGQTPGLSPALVLEMSAAATRDPEIAAAVAAFDTAIRTDITDWFHRAHADKTRRLTARAATIRALMLQCLIDGLKVRQTREPEIDRKLLKAALNEVIPSLLK